MSKERFKSYGYTEFYKKQIEALNINGEEFSPARVTEVHRERYKIVTEFGENNAILKSSLFYNNENNIYPTVGDFVVVATEGRFSCRKILYTWRKYYEY